MDVRNPRTDTPRHFMDSTASTHLPLPVLERIAQSLFSYANVHRGEYDASMATTEEFERSYNIAANLVNARSWREIIFGRNATDMINLVRRGMERQVRSGDNIVVTALEHNSNYVPWVELKATLADFGREVDIRIVPFDLKTGELNMSELKHLVDKRTKLVAVTGASNFMGVKPDVATIGEIAHASGYVQPDGFQGSYLLVDGAQLVPGSPVDVQNLDCDFLAWSFHKMALPLGVGGLWARKEAIQHFDPYISGGDMILDVTPDAIEFQDLPWKYTAGTPNILGVIGTGFGIEFLISMALGNLSEHDEIERTGKRIETEILLNTPRGDFEYSLYNVEERHPAEVELFGRYVERHHDVMATLQNPQKRLEKTKHVVRTAMEKIQYHEQELTQRAIDGLVTIPGITLYGPTDATQRTGLIAFNLAGIEPMALAFALNREGVEVRNGVHCASLAHHYLGIRETGSVRMSVYVPTTQDEVTAAVDAVTRIQKRLH